MCFWNNLHQVRSKPKYLNVKKFKGLWEQENQGKTIRKTVRKTGPK